MWSGGAIYDKQIYRIYTFEQALKYHTKKRLKKKKKKRNTGAKIRQKKWFKWVKQKQSQLFNHVFSHSFYTKVTVASLEAI